MKHMNQRFTHGLMALALCLTLLLAGCDRGVKPVHPSAPLNDRNMADFTTDENGFVHYPGALNGVDVSDHQGEIDWARVKAAGGDFAILRLGFRGYTEGNLKLDDRFEENYRGAQEAGLLVGVYFYSQATSKEEAWEEAEFVLEVLSDRKLDLPVFYDWEEVATGRTGGYATSAVGDYAIDFCRAITEGGYKAGTYFNQRYGYSIMHLESMTDYSFWLAEYATYQSFGFQVAFWQYTGSGTIDGIDTVVDLDLYYQPENET